MRIIGNSFHATEKGKQVLDFGAHRVHGTVNETHLGSKSKSFPLLQQIVSPPLAAPHAQLEECQPRPEHPFYTSSPGLPIPPYPLTVNCKGRAETTRVQTGSRTQGAVKHKADCLSQRTTDCVSLWGIPLSMLAPSVYIRFVWPEKVMWWKKRKEEFGGGGGNKKKKKKTHISAQMWMCIKCIKNYCLGSEGSWIPTHFQLGSYQRAHTHLENTEIKRRIWQSPSTH